MPYEWMDNWARIPDSPSGRANGRTHAVCVTREGNIVVFHQAENGLATYDPQGKLISAVGGSRWLGAHGMTKIVAGGQEFLWLADQNSAEVVKVTLQGKTVMELSPPVHPAYTGPDAKTYVPTWAAENPLNGEIWVGDGYGAHLLHRYAKDGRHVDTIDSPGAAGRLHETHGVNFRVKDGKAELFVTSRSDHRIVVLDGDGRFLRQATTCHSPCGFDFLGNHVVVPELFTGVKVLDADTLGVITEIGSSDRVKPNPDGSWWPPITPAGWPDLAGTEHVRPGFFNSPHGACFAPNGDIFAVEWIIGGRITRLHKV